MDDDSLYSPMKSRLNDPSPAAAPSRARSLLSNRPLMLLGALAVVLLGAIAGGAAFAANQAGQPGQALTRFCADLTQQKYADAYGLLSSGARAQTSQDQWVQQQQLHDQVDGPAHTCSAGQTSGGWLTFAVAGSSASVKITRAKPSSGVVVLAHQANGWKVDKIDPRLQGTDLAPLHVAESFCAALAAQDFVAAYADLSSRQHAGTSQADWAKAYTQALGSASAKVTGCAPNLASYSVQPPSAQVDIAMQEQVATSAGATTVAVPFRFTLVSESAGWKIDVITANGQ
jgi:hypothetical protein